MAKPIKLKSLNDRMIVTRIEEEQKTGGGIIIPDTPKEKPQEGKIVAAGPGKLDDIEADKKRNSKSP